jgi:hypothetical protein
VKVGDLVICRGKHQGIILAVDKRDIEDENIIWAKIMWSNSRITWEDMICSMEDDLFKVISGSR